LGIFFATSNFFVDQLELSDSERFDISVILTQCRPLHGCFSLTFLSQFDA